MANLMDKNLDKPYYQYYLIFMSTQIISIFGSNITSFVIIWWITIETQSALYLAFSSFITFGVRIILSPIAGVYIDRWNRKLIIGFADFGQALVILYIIFRFSIGNANVYDVLLLIFLASIFGSFHGPAVNSIIPIMVPKEKINRINSMNYFASVLTRVIGAPIGALLLNFWSISSLLWIDVFTFIIALIPLLVISIPSIHPVIDQEINSKNSFIHDFKEGFSIIKSRGMIGFFFVFPITNFFETPKNILLPLLISDIYAGDAFLFALIISTAQLTISLTALMMSWKNFTESLDPAKVVLFGIFGIFTAAIIMALPPPGTLGYYIILTLIGAVLMGFCSPFINITMQNIQHKVIPADKMGRVGATSSAASLSMIPPATLLTGFVTDYVGNEFIPIIIITTCIMGIIAMGLIWLFTDLSDIKYRINEGVFDTEISQNLSRDPIQVVPD